MAQSNHERIGKALELLNDGLRPFVEREMKRVYADKWLDAAQAGLREDRAPATANKKSKQPNWGYTGSFGGDVGAVERRFRQPAWPR